MRLSEIIDTDVLLFTQRHRRTSLVEKTVQRLLGEVRKAAAQKHDHLSSEQDLAAQLGVSRPVIREATKVLESQGLLRVEHGSGIRIVDELGKPISRSFALRVPNLSKRLHQLAEVRLILEPELTRLAASRCTARELRELRSINERLGKASKTEEAVALDIQFHRGLALATRNAVAVLLLDSVAALGRESRSITVGTYGVECTHREHDRIVKALEARAPEEAGSAMRAHIEQAMRSLRRLEGKLRRSRSSQDRFALHRRRCQLQ